MAICDDILCGFSSGGMDDYIHTKSPCLPSNPSCPALFPFEPEAAPPSRPRASHARADRCAHFPTPSGRPKACHDFLFEFRRRAEAAGDEQGVAAAEGGDRR